NKVTDRTGNPKLVSNLCTCAETHVHQEFKTNPPKLKGQEYQIANNYSGTGEILILRGEQQCHKQGKIVGIFQGVDIQCYQAGAAIRRGEGELRENHQVGAIKAYLLNKRRKYQR